jgi:hypothetical protein
MRVSVYESDPGYANSQGRQYEVRVDGRVLTNCVTADEESGWAQYHVVDQLGLHVLVDREFLTRTVRGVVQIVDVTFRDAVAAGFVRATIESVESIETTIPLENKAFVQSTDRPDKIAVAPDVIVRDLR